MVVNYFDGLLNNINYVRTFLFGIPYKKNAFNAMSAESVFL